MLTTMATGLTSHTRLTTSKGETGRGQSVITSFVSVVTPTPKIITRKAAISVHLIFSTVDQREQPTRTESGKLSSICRMSTMLKVK